MAELERGRDRAAIHRVAPPRDPVMETSLVEAPLRPVAGRLAVRELRPHVMDGVPSPGWRRAAAAGSWTASVHALPLLRVHEVAAAPLHRVRPVLALGDDGLAPEAAREVEFLHQIGDERHAAAFGDVPEEVERFLLDRPPPRPARRAVSLYRLPPRPA